MNILFRPLLAAIVLILVLPAPAVFAQTAAAYQNQNNTFTKDNTFSGRFTATSTVSLKGYTLDTFAASLMTATNSADMAGKLGVPTLGGNNTYTGSNTMSRPIITAPAGYGWIFDGDSIPAGSGVTSTTRFSHYFSQMSFCNGGTVRNVAVAGTGIGAALARYTANVYPHRPTANGGDGGAGQYLFYPISSNDAYSGTVDTISASISAYVATAQSHGFKFILGTSMPVAPGTPNWPMSWLLGELNARARSGQFGADYVFEYAATLGDPADTTSFPDGIHPNALCHYKIAQNLNTFMSNGGATHNSQQLVSNSSITSPTSATFGGALLIGSRSLSSGLYVGPAGSDSGGPMLWQYGTNTLILVTGKGSSLDGQINIGIRGEPIVMGGGGINEAVTNSVVIKNHLITKGNSTVSGILKVGSTFIGDYGADPGGSMILNFGGNLLLASTTSGFLCVGFRGEDVVLGGNDTQRVSGATTVVNQFIAKQNATVSGVLKVGTIFIGESGADPGGPMFLLASPHILISPASGGHVYVGWRGEDVVLGGNDTHHLSGKTVVVNGLVAKSGLTVTGSATISGDVATAHLKFGAGSPEGVETAGNEAVTYYNTTGTTSGTVIYVRPAGLGTGNTGWVAK